MRWRTLKCDTFKLCFGSQVRLEFYLIRALMKDLYEVIQVENFFSTQGFRIVRIVVLLSRQFLVTVPSQAYNLFRDGC